MTRTNNGDNIERWGSDSPFGWSGTVDPSDIDRAEELLAEEIGCSVEQAQRAIVWWRTRYQDDIVRCASRLVGMAIGDLVAETQVASLRPKLVGLMFAAGLDTGRFGSQAQAARAFGCTRALISHYVHYWREKFFLHWNAHQKSDDAGAVYSRVQTADHFRRRPASRAIKHSHN